MDLHNQYRIICVGNIELVNKIFKNNENPIVTHFDISYYELNETNIYNSDDYVRLKIRLSWISETIFCNEPGYRSIGMRPAGIIIVYDASEKKSLESTTQIINHAKKCYIKNIILIGITQPGKTNVCFRTMFYFAKTNKIHFYQCSSYNIDEELQLFTKQIYEYYKLNEKHTDHLIYNI